MLLGILFCVCLISANLLATKQIMFGPFNITAGILVFPISYIVNDCIVEVWGFNKAKLLIWTGFAMNFLFVAFGFVADLIPGAPYWDNAEGFHKLFGLAPRVAAASFILPSLVRCGLGISFKDIRYLSIATESFSGLRANCIYCIPLRTAILAFSRTPVIIDGGVKCE